MVLEPVTRDSDQLLVKTQNVRGMVQHLISVMKYLKKIQVQ